MKEERDKWTGTIYDEQGAAMVSEQLMDAYNTGTVDEMSKDDSKRSSNKDG